MLRARFRYQSNARPDHTATVKTDDCDLLSVRSLDAARLLCSANTANAPVMAALRSQFGGDTVTPTLELPFLFPGAESAGRLLYSLARRSPVTKPIGRAVIANPVRCVRRRHDVIAQMARLPVSRPETKNKKPGGCWAPCYQGDRDLAKCLLLDVSAVHLRCDANANAGT